MDPVPQLFPFVRVAIPNGWLAHHIAGDGTLEFLRYLVIQTFQHQKRRACIHGVPGGTAGVGDRSLGSNGEAGDALWFFS